MVAKISHVFVGYLGGNIFNCWITYTFDIANKMAQKIDAKMAPQYGRINGNIDAI